MRITLSLIVFLLAFSVFAVAQDSEEISRNEFYAGYLRGQSDETLFSNGSNGYNFGYTRNIAKYVGIRGEMAGTFKSSDFDSQSPNGPVNFETRASFYTFHAGVQFKNNEKKGKLKPFGHVLAGVAHNRARFACRPAPNCVGNARSFLSKETGFSAGIGGGLDLRINDRLDVRLMQIEYNPVHIEGQLINNIRFGVGIVIK